MLLEDRVAIVTGSGRGIGREFALCLASEGAKVVVNDVGASLSGETTE
jgi:NAD(P)-dependent dehydrogenase (short-subunit alcohol dehydrogenase family)